MDERQARELIRQAFRQQDLAVRATNAADSALMASLQRIAALIKTLPPAGDLLREQAWRKIRPQITAELDGYATQLGVNLLNTLKGEVDQAEAFARVFTPGQEAAAASAPAFTTFVEGMDVRVTTGQTYFNALTRSRVVDQSFGSLFNVTLDESGEILYVQNKRGKVARFFASSVDKLVTRGVLEGQSTDDIVNALVSESQRGLNLGMSGRQLKSQAQTLVRTGIAEALARAHEAFWDDNDEDIVGWFFDASMDSRTCPWCAMYDQQEEKDRDKLPRIPVHPRCRCQVLPLTKAAKLLREEDKKDGTLPTGSAIELFKEDELPGRRKGESVKDFISRMRDERKRAQAFGGDLNERWYATPVIKDGVRYWRRAKDLPAGGRSGILNVPEWLARAGKTTQIDFFGGGNAGLVRQKLFEQMVGAGRDPREALAKLLSRDSDTVRNVKPYRFKPSKDLAK